MAVVSEGEGAVHPHHFPAEGLLLVRDLHHVDLAVQIEEGAGHREGGAPLAGAGLGGNALEALLFGVVGLGNGGVQLVRAGGVVPLKLVVDLGGGAQGLLQKLRVDQGRGPVHLVEVQNLPGNVEIGGGVVQLLLDQLVAEHGPQLLEGHGLMGGGVQQGGRLVFHVGPQVVPCLGQLAFIQIDFVGDLCHDEPSFQIVVLKCAQPT